PLLDLLSVLHVDGTNDAALQGLNDFGVAAWNDFALGYGNEIDGAEGPPKERCREHGHDRPGEQTPDRGRRGFLNLQHGREKLPGLPFGRRCASLSSAEHGMVPFSLIWRRTDGHLGDGHLGARISWRNSPCAPGVPRV